jgi:hypothetical protein
MSLSIWIQPVSKWRTVDGMEIKGPVEIEEQEWKIP